MKKATVIGHFGFGSQFLDGQTIKTKIVTKELERRFEENEILNTDTHGGAKALLKSPLQVVNALKSSKNVIILPAHNGLRVYVPLLSTFRLFFKHRKLHYVVIGGWLPEFLNDRKLLAKQLKRFDGVYVETNTMKKSLETMGFENIIVMPNCKELTVLKESELVYPTEEPYRLCTFSRVMKEKGIEYAIEAVKAVNLQFQRTVFTLDIYGQIDDGYKKRFEELRENFPDYIKYGGMVPYNQSVEVLKRYYALLFPTYYDGEGFAGTLIDALAAGLPVIASDWRYNSEIVREEITGLIYPSRNIKALANKLNWIHKNQEKWNCMKINCISDAKKYLPEVTIQKLVDQLQ